MPGASILRFIADPAAGDFAALARRAQAGGATGTDPAIHGTAVAAALAVAGLAMNDRRPILALAPPAATGGSRLLDALSATLGDDHSLRPIRPHGVDPVSTRSWLAARQRDRRAALLAGPPPAFAELLGPIERRGLRFRLPARSSALLVTASVAAPNAGLRTRLLEGLGLALNRLWLAWEADGVATPFVARWNEEPRFAIPHWVRVKAGASGALVVTDLANLGGPLEVVTQTRARIDGDRLLLP